MACDFIPDKAIFDKQFGTMINTDCQGDNNT